MDWKIILWDVGKLKKRREYAGHHKKAIVAMDYCEELVLLVSGSIDHVLFIWNPYIEAPVFKLQEHEAPIVGLKFVSDPLHLLSLDTDGILKVWNLKKM